uniref:Uncharacterized protein n=1 Tax=viral metagenome TaxID=1070528 RepID=A0A6M3LKT9_9ZZZZ
MPKYGVIIDCVALHDCLPETAELELTPCEVPTYTKGTNDKFISSLDKKSPPRSNAEGAERPRGFGMTGTDDLRDRRFTRDEAVKTTAPPNIRQLIDKMSPTQPANDLEPESEE